MRRLVSLLVVLVAAVFALSGCAGETTDSTGADLASGKQLFSQKCGSCHVMQAAGTQGQIGPNLDYAFGHPRSQEFEESTLFEVALGQMSIPVAPMPDFDEEGTKDYLSEEDRIAIAAFVAQCSALDPKDVTNAGCAAGSEGAGDSSDGKTIFTQSCGSCHTFESAGTTGAVGPNLDESQLELEAAIQQIENGGNGMPPFADTLTAKQIEAVARYVVENRS